jgi:hypothetical protein
VAGDRGCGLRGTAAPVVGAGVVIAGATLDGGATGATGRGAGAGAFGFGGEGLEGSGRPPPRGVCATRATLEIVRRAMEPLCPRATERERAAGFEMRAGVGVGAG